MSALTDNDKMTFGKHKGEKLANVPASYLIWLFDNGKCFGNLKDYINENMHVLAQEAARDNKFLAK